MANIRKRGNSYQIRVSCGYNTHGEQIIKTTTWKPPAGMTAKQAEKEVNKQAIIFEEKCLKGYQSSTVKFQEFAEQWFTEYAIPNLRKNTLEGIKKTTRRVYPVIGHIKLDKITHRHIQQFITDLSVNGKNLRNGKPLARKTVIHHLNFISDVMTYAVKIGMISENPCRSVMVPKGTKKEIKIYTLEEVEKLISLVETAPMKYRVFFVLSVYSGLRRGELLGLEWHDFDFKTNVFHVRRTANYTKTDGCFTDTTKTKAAQRSMKLPDYVMDLLKEWKAEQEKYALLLGTKWIETDRLFTGNYGATLHPCTPYKWLAKFCKSNGLPFYGIHSQRHFFASSLIHANVDLAAVSSALGHSDPSITNSIYLHYFQDANARAGEAIASVLDFSKKKDDKPSNNSDDTIS